MCSFKIEHLTSVFTNSLIIISKILVIKENSKLSEFNTPDKFENFTYRKPNLTFYEVLYQLHFKGTRPLISSYYHYFTYYSQT